MIKGIGVDIIEINRIRQAIDKFAGRFLERVFTAEERAFCSSRLDPCPCYAARFAAKEAVLKAMGTGLAKGCRWRDVEVTSHTEGPPAVMFHGRVAELAREKGVMKVLLSLSHDKSQAIAFALLIGKDKGVEGFCELLPPPK